MKFRLAILALMLVCRSYGVELTNVYNGLSITNGTRFSSVWNGVFPFPTNLPNAKSISWWNLSDYTTNAGVPTLTDRWTNGYTLTNLYTSADWGKWPATTLNGYHVIQFPQVSHANLISANYTSSQPHTVCMIIDIVDIDATSRNIFDSWSATYRNNLATTTSAANPRKVNPYAGAASGNYYILTNLWCLVECGFTNGGSYVMTNGILAGAASNAGTQPCSGFTLGSGYTGGNPTASYIAEVMTYASVFTASDRNWLSNYVRATYGAGTVVP